jgi:hypothetical protein
MIDWLVSRFSLVVFFLLLGSSILGVLNLQKENFIFQELQLVVQTLADSINELQSLSSEAELRITFNQTKPGIKLPLKIGNSYYKLELSSNFIIATLKNNIAKARFLGIIYLCSANSNIMREEFLKLSSKFKLSIVSGEDFWIVRRLTHSSKYLTFVYSENSKSLQSSAELLASRLVNLTITKLSSSDVKEVFLANHKLLFYKNILIIEANNTRIGTIIPSCFLFNPFENNISNKTTLKLLSSLAERFEVLELTKGDRFYAAPLLLELLDCQLENGDNKSILVLFIYKFQGYD